jgi:hypothetical protein
MWALPLQVLGWVNHRSVLSQGDTIGAVSVFHAKQAQRNTVQSVGNSFLTNTARVMEGQCLGGSLGVMYMQLSINETLVVDRDKHIRNSCWATQQGSAFGGAVAVWLNEDSTGARLAFSNVTYSENNATALDSAIGGGVCVFNNGQSMGIPSPPSSQHLFGFLAFFGFF